MANWVLFCSSICIYLTHMVTIWRYSPPKFFSILALLASATSLLNHGTTSKISQMIDRSYMYVYIAANTIIIYSVTKDLWNMLTMYLIMFTGVVCVKTAMRAREKSTDKDIKNPHKIHKDGNYFHLYSHLVVMVVHTMLCLTMVDDCAASSAVFCSDEWLHTVYSRIVL